MSRSVEAQWDQALNLVDEKVQELKYRGFSYLSKRPYRTELKESTAAVTYTLYVDLLDESLLRIVVRAQSQLAGKRSFAHGFDQHRDGRVSPVSPSTLGEYG